MRARPILFSAPMIRALLEVRKTQTRRIIRAPTTRGSFVSSFNNRGMFELNFGPEDRKPNGELRWHACRYGQPGDLLWVRETWAPVSPDESPRCITDCEIEYRADKPGCVRAGGWECEPDDPEAIRWRSPIHMPRWASRLTLRITDVRVQRLEDISEADAMAEGAPPSHPSIDAISREYGYPDFPRSWYAQLWDSLNGAGSWNANPWVWALTFEVIKQNVEAVLASRAAS